MKKLIVVLILVLGGIGLMGYLVSRLPLKYRSPLGYKINKQLCKTEGYKNTNYCKKLNKEEE